MSAHLPTCPNCGELGSHFAPPRLAEPGYFTCTAQRSADKVGPQSIATTIKAVKDVSEQAAAARLLDDQNKPGAAVKTLSLLAALSTGGQRNAAGRHATFEVRRDARRVSTPKELREAADMLEQGRPMPGTKGDALLRDAVAAGDFAEQARLVAEMQKLAPVIRAQADVVELNEANAVDATVAQARSDFARMDKAAAKRRRKAQKRA